MDRPREAIATGDRAPIVEMVGFRRSGQPRGGLRVVVFFAGFLAGLTAGFFAAGAFTAGAALPEVDDRPTAIGVPSPSP